MHPLIVVLVVLAILVLFMYLISQFAPKDAQGRTILYITIAVAGIIGLLIALGVFKI